MGYKFPYKNFVPSELNHRRQTVTINWDKKAGVIASPLKKLLLIRLNSTKQTWNGHHKGFCRHTRWPQLGDMGSTDPGGGQGLKLLERDKRRKNPGHYTTHIWPTHITSARHRRWTDLQCNPYCQVTLQMEQDELDGPGPNPGKVEPSGGPTTLMLEMPQRSGPIWKPSMEKQEELIPTVAQKTVPMFDHFVMFRL